MARRRPRARPSPNDRTGPATVKVKGEFSRWLAHTTHAGSHHGHAGIPGVVAIGAHAIIGFIVVRVIHDMGAVSSAVLACIADLTAEAHRTMAMAMAGGATGMSCAVAIAFHRAAMRRLAVGRAFSVPAVGVVNRVVPGAPGKPVHVRALFAEVLHNVELLRLNFGVLVLHATQTAPFLVAPHLLVDAGLPVASHRMSVCRSCAARSS